jgi:hypothetical protein
MEFLFAPDVSGAERGLGFFQGTDLFFCAKQEWVSERFRRCLKRFRSLFPSNVI